MRDLQKRDLNTTSKSAIGFCKVEAGGLKCCSSS